MLFCRDPRGKQYQLSSQHVELSILPNRIPTKPKRAPKHTSPIMLSMMLLVILSVVNSLALTLTIWAALQRKHTDWWVVFLVIFIIGLAYQVASSKSTPLQSLWAALTISQCAATSLTGMAATTTRKTTTALRSSWTIWLALPSPACAALADLVQLLERTKLAFLAVWPTLFSGSSHCK